MKNPILILSLVTILVASGLVNIGLLPLQQSFAYISPLRLEQLLHIANNNCEYNCDDGGGTGGGDNGGGGTGGGDPDIIQDPSCISVGGNSPITDSCNNAAISNNTNSGGNIGTGNGPSGSGNRASGPSIKQGPVCMTVGGNSPITGSCVNGGTIMNINTGGTVHSNSGTAVPTNTAGTVHSNSGTAVPTNTAGTVHSNSGRAVPFNNGGTDRIPLPTFS